MVDAHGAPLALRMTGANASDQNELTPTVLKLPRVAGKRGRPKERPDAVVADRGYDSEANRLILM